MRVEPMPPIRKLAQMSLSARQASNGRRATVDNPQKVRQSLTRQILCTALAPLRMTSVTRAFP